MHVQVVASLHLQVHISAYLYLQVQIAKILHMQVQLDDYLHLQQVYIAPPLLKLCKKVRGAGGHQLSYFIL